MSVSHSEVNNHHGNENMPLLEVGTNGNISKPPIATIETLEDDDDRETVTKPYPGVDDGFFNPNSNHPDIEPNIPVLSNRAGEADESDGKSVGVGTGTVVPIHPDTRHHFPYAPGYGPDFEGTFTDLESIPDVNVYQHKKTLAQGMMDLALFSANANQLRYVLETYNRHPYYYPSVILITISLLLQVAVGIGLIWNATYNVKDKKEICIANKINNFTIIGIFLVTVVNVFISAFGVADPVVQLQT